MRSLLIIFSLFAAITMHAADPLEGRWQVNGDGALVDIVATAGTSGVMEMRWVDGPDLSIEPGTVVGTITPSSTAKVYDCHALVDPRQSNVAKQRKVYFAIRFLGDSANDIGFEAYERRRRISLWRWIPYMFRVSLTKEASRPNELDGASRVTDYPDYIVL